MLSLYHIGSLKDAIKTLSYILIVFLCASLLFCYVRDYRKPEIKSPGYSIPELDYCPLPKEWKERLEKLLRDGQRCIGGFHVDR